jgi:hypothetical protein
MQYQGPRVVLRNVVQEMDVPDDDWSVFLNRRTGELVTVTGEEASAVEDGEFDEDELDYLDDERIQLIRTVFESDDYLQLPSRFDIDEYHIMERFCRQVEDEHIRDDLLQAIHRPGAFGRFKTLVQHCRLMDDWYAFRDRALEEIAIEWLEDHRIAYDNGAGPEGGRGGG